MRRAPVNARRSNVIIGSRYPSVGRLANMANLKKSDLLKEPIEHVDITKFDARPLIDAYAKMAFSARDLARASDIYDRMLADKDCDAILCLGGSLFSAGLKKIV